MTAEGRRVVAPGIRDFWRGRWGKQWVTYLRFSGAITLGLTLVGVKH